MAEISPDNQRLRRLKVFRVQPQAYTRLLDATKEARNRSERIRQLLMQACATPPQDFPARAIKADLTAFSVFLADEETQALAEASTSAGVSRNVFVEAVFAQLEAEHACA